MAANESSPVRIFAWAIPRTISTAFTKCLSAVEGMEIWLELFTHASMARKEYEKEKNEMPMEYEGNEDTGLEAAKLLRRLLGSELLPQRLVQRIFNEGKNAPQHPAWHLGEVVVQTASLHPHLGIIKSSIRRDPTEDIIAKGLKTFYALTGSGAYTGGLLPNHSATLWKVYCVPRMLYGVAIMTLTKGMKRRLDQAQQQLFKQILGIPKTAADESVYLLTGLIPLSTQVDQEKLLLIGQLLNLPHDRFEYRTFLHALSSQTTSIKAWQDTLSRYKLPDLHSLILQPVPYSQWKKLVKCAIHSMVVCKTSEAVQLKSTLSFWRSISIPPPNHLYPRTV